LEVTLWTIVLYIGYIYIGLYIGLVKSAANILSTDSELETGGCVLVVVSKSAGKIIQMRNIERNIGSS
jgi:hypothetical protein